MNLRRRDKGFTLVELLVVIGIISILISILLPVVSRAQDQARSAACKSNLRQLVIALQTYATDNKQSLPYGFYFANGGGTGLGNPASSSSSPYVAWFTLLNRTMNSKSSPDVTNGATGVGSTMGYQVSKVFRCPGAEDFRQQVHYYQNPIAMPHLTMELKTPAVRVSGATTVKSYLSFPAKTTDLYNDNALFWDTPLLMGLSGNSPAPFINFQAIQEAGTANSVYPVSFIDKESLRNPLRPELRFRSPNSDLFANQPDTAYLRGSQSIWFPTDEKVAVNPLFRTGNGDMGGNTSNSYFVGNVRFRHQKNTIANVAFTDGSVQGLPLNKGRTTGTDSYDTGFKRDMLRIKWPTGFAPSDQAP